MPLIFSDSGPGGKGNLSMAERVALVRNPDQRAEILAELAMEEPDLEHSAAFWLRPNDQLSALNASESTVVMLSGRGGGKTRTGSNWVNQKAKENPGARIHLVGRTVADVRDVMVQGEALALDTPVATPTGWATMGDLRAGDQVLGADGYPVVVSWVSEIHVNRPCFSIVFSDGEQIIADANHKWLTWTHQARRFNSLSSKHQPEVVRTEDITHTLRMPNGQVNHAIANTQPLDLKPCDLPIPPYTLGAWLGDGHSYHAGITTMDPEVLAGVAADGFALTEWSDHGQQGRARTYGILGLSRLLKNTGLLANKHVPDAYFRSSYQQRLDLLRGLLDTDGSIDATGRVEFSNTNEHLAQAVVELVASLGLRSRWRVQPSKIGHLPLHRVGFCTGLPVFTIRRKVERLVPPRSSEHGFRYIVDVQPTESVPVRCIAVDNDDHLFLVGRTLVPTHNSGILALSPPDFMPQYVPSIRKVIWPNSTVAITFSSESPDQLRGPQSHFTWADELAAFKLSRSDVNAWEQITISTRLGEHPQIFVTTTPKRIPLIRELVDRAQQPESDVLIVTGSTYDNRANLSSEYLQTLIDLYAGTALEEQELYGRLVLVVEGSLWKDRDFVIAPLPPGWNIPDKMAHDIFGPNKPEFVTVIGVDPSASSGGDETGIVRVQTTRQRDEHISQRRAWVTADRSVQGPPEQWAKAVADLYHESNEDHLTVVVAEKNQGGEMVRTVIQSADPAIPVALIPSVKSKAARAEPVVLAYRRGRVFHTEDFPELTGQLTEWEPSSKWSPDRLDALVHAVTAVLIDDRPLRPYSRMTIASLDDTRLLDGVNSRARQETRSMNLGSWRGRQTAPVIHDPAEYFR